MTIRENDARENLSDYDKDSRFSAFSSSLRISRRSELALLLSVHSPRVVFIWREIEGSKEFIDLVRHFTIIPIWRVTPDDYLKN